ncbi:MAG: LPXTG cell wall anchor domain-containing protein, partial [Blautia sp.]|uniref:LPXTG cell wall anchor domain-containing protein n=1 Tax=Blautia sp. TaxID=1955243 RepID=UPI00257C9C3B
SQNNNENTSQNNNSSETNNSQDDSTGKQPPKTGDPTSFASLYALAGSALAGIGAVKLKFKKRK